MKEKIKEIRIPARLHAPETSLRIRMVYKNKASLASLPYVFILPGGPGSNHSYYMDYDCIHEVANLVYYDPRGCGLSDKGDRSSYTLGNYIDDLHFIIRALQVGPVILLGKSYGAISALGYTLRYPQEVRQLILAAGAPSYHFLDTAKSNILSRGTADQQRICNDLWKGQIKNHEHMDQFFKTMATMYSWKKRNNRPVNRPASTHSFSFDAANEGFSKQLWQFDYLSKLDTIQCPTLILVGEEDWITDPQYSKQMAAMIPQSILQVFKHADHSLESDVPEQYFNTLMNFIRVC